MMPTQLNTSSGSWLWAGDMGAVELAVHLFWFFFWGGGGGEGIFRPVGGDKNVVAVTNPG